MKTEEQARLERDAEQAQMKAAIAELQYQRDAEQAKQQQLLSRIELEHKMREHLTDEQYEKYLFMKRRKAVRKREQHLPEELFTI